MVVFVVLEGIHGCGKSAVFDAFPDNIGDSVVIKLPEPKPLSYDDNLIRRELSFCQEVINRLTSREYPPTMRMDFGDVEPIVLMDRGLWSAFAYSLAFDRLGYASGCFDAVKEFLRGRNVLPEHYYVYICVQPEVAVERCIKRGAQWIWERDMTFAYEILKCFGETLNMACDFGGRLLCELDGTLPTKHLVSKIVGEIESLSGG